MIPQFTTSLQWLSDRLQRLDTVTLNNQMDRDGYALLPGLLTPETCDELRALYDRQDGYRKTVNMERYRFGKGEYKYFSYPLPGIIAALREQLYPLLAPVANNWMQALQIPKQFPARLEALREECIAAGQDKPTVLILKYGPGGFNTLHQDLYGDIYFPMQLVLCLSEPGDEYEGGEFVLTQQVPRAQSKAMVLRPRKGDALVFTTSFRPEQGSRGYYRVHMKHGISAVTSGIRYALGIIFHDALS